MTFTYISNHHCCRLIQLESNNLTAKLYTCTYTCMYIYGISTLVMVMHIHDREKGNVYYYHSEFSIGESRHCDVSDFPPLLQTFTLKYSKWQSSSPRIHQRKILHQKEQQAIQHNGRILCHLKMHH